MALRESMSCTSEEEPLIKPRELVFLLAIAGRLDAQSKHLIKELDDQQYIYHAYNVVDSLSSSYSMYKYFFELFISSVNDPLLMYQFMVSPLGILAITGETCFLVTFSFLASYFADAKNTEKEKVKYFIKNSWPYFRDAMKGMKNAYKGWKAAIQIVNLLSGADLRVMLIPVGLGLGIIAATNRMYLRSIDNKRRDMIINNKTLITEFQIDNSLRKQTHELILAGNGEKRILSQSEHEKITSFILKGFGGLIDGLYLYVGLVSLSVLASPAFIAMVALSSFYTLICVVSRIYEEYTAQMALVVTNTSLRLLLVSKELETTYRDLCTLKDNANEREGAIAGIDSLQKEVVALIERFEALNSLLKSQSTHSYLTKGLEGIRNGLFAYGVLASFLFMLTVVLSLTPAVFPPVLLMACIVSGLVMIAGITVYNLSSHNSQIQNKKKEEDVSVHRLVDIKDKIKANVNTELLSEEDLKDSLKKEKFNESLAKNDFQERLEVPRSLFSGFSKGFNFAVFINAPFQDLDHNDHDHCSSGMILFMLKISNAMLFSIILGLRALVRGFRPAKTKTYPVADPVLPSEGHERLDECVRKAPARSPSILRFSIFWPIAPEQKPVHCPALSYTIS